MKGIDGLESSSEASNTDTAQISHEKGCSSLPRNDESESLNEGYSKSDNDSQTGLSKSEESEKGKNNEPSENEKQTRENEQVLRQAETLNNAEFSGTRAQVQFPISKMEDLTDVEMNKDGGISCTEYPISSTPGMPQVDNGESSDDSTCLHIVVPTSKKRKRKEIQVEIEREIEEDIQRELEKKARKTNLTVKNVKSILRYVIGNDSVLALVRNSMKNSGADAELEYEPKLTRSLTRQLRKENQMLWPLSPIRPPPQELKVLIDEELPEEEDDEEYRPNFDDLQDPSDDETGRGSVASSCNVSTASRYLETFDPRLLDDSAHDSSLPGTEDQATGQPITDVFNFKKPGFKECENIGQRTRSKFSLSSTPLETIEQAFIPPDITTDMYDFQCDNEEWGNFLKEFMQPLSNDTADNDEEDDPEYNILAEEEEIDREELRRDRAVTVSKAELRTLMIELLEGVVEEASSDDEAHKTVNIADSALKNKTSDEKIDEIVPEDKTEEQFEEEEEELVIGDEGSVDLKEEPRSPPPSPPRLPSPEPPVIGVTSSQALLLRQQLRQHIQYLTQHFLQTYQNPRYNNIAGMSKNMLVQLVEIGKANQESVTNVYNLQKALDLIEDWESFIDTEKGEQVIEHMKKEQELSDDAVRKRNIYRNSFHPFLMTHVIESDVFLYPLLLPSQPFRLDPPFRPEFLDTEDQLIAIGMEQFRPHVKTHRDWYNIRWGVDKTTANLIRQLMCTCKTSIQIHRRIKQMKKVENSPIWFFHQHGKPPKTIHHVIPFNDLLVIPPRKQHPELLPDIWRDFVYPELKK